MNTECLLRLADMLDCVPAERFDMLVFRRTSPAGLVCCAIEWAARAVSFKADGFIMHPRDDYPVYCPGDGRAQLCGFEAIMSYFAIPLETVNFLFVCRAYPRDDAPPADVAARIRSCVANELEARAHQGGRNRDC